MRQGPLLSFHPLQETESELVISKEVGLGRATVYLLASGVEGRMRRRRYTGRL